MELPLKPFEDAMAECGLQPLHAAGIDVLQVNLGRLCNQACRHCHVEAGPDRREIMDRRTVDICLDVLAKAKIPLLDITGGAPEMNPHFRHLVQSASKLDCRVIDRSNLTIFTVPGYEDLPELLARHSVEVVASLPCYSAENVDSQRGGGTFDRSIGALRRLNDLGYGRADSSLVLGLVYNPVGPTLPPDQTALEETYRRELQSQHGVIFNRLITMTNMPLGRFRRELIQRGQYDGYLETLAAALNPAAAGGVMCRTTLSVDWTGRLFDCDFNQMLDSGLAEGLPQRIDRFDFDRLADRPIVTGEHCYGCTAGAGSSCQGATVKTKEES